MSVPGVSVLEVLIQGVSVQVGVSVLGGLCPEGLCLGVSVHGIPIWGYLSGSLSRQISVQSGLCPGVPLSRGGCCRLGGVCLGVSIQGSLSRGGCCLGGLCLGVLCLGGLCLEGDPISPPV